MNIVLGQTVFFSNLYHRLRKEILADAPRYIRDPRTPKRDRLAVLLLRLGFPTFYGGWNLYMRMRA